MKELLVKLCTVKSHSAIREEEGQFRIAVDSNVPTLARCILLGGPARFMGCLDFCLGLGGDAGNPGSSGSRRHDCQSSNWKWGVRVLLLVLIKDARIFSPI